MKCKATKKRIHINVWAVVIGTLLIAVACSPLGTMPDSSVSKTYLLQGEQPAGQLNPACPTLLLSSARAAPGYAGSGMAYIEEPHRIDYFAHHRWADSPARMLEPVLMHALEASGLFQAVVQAPTAARFDLRLDTELLRLVQVFEPTESRVEVAIHFALLDTHERRVLISERLEVTEPATERTPYAGVIAANKAIDRLLGQLQQVLRPVLEPRCAE